MLKKGIRNYLS